MDSAWSSNPHSLGRLGALSDGLGSADALVGMGVGVTVGSGVGVSVAAGGVADGDGSVGSLGTDDSGVGVG